MQPRPLSPAILQLTLLLFLAIWQSGCATEYAITTADWTYSSNVPGVRFRVKSYPDNDNGTQTLEMEIQNIGSQKLRLVGVATHNQNAGFIDLQQPGAFDVTLYPGQSTFREVDNARAYPSMGTFGANLVIHDWTIVD